MHLNENSVDYDTIGSFLFEKLPLFRKYFFVLNDESDLEEKYTLLWSLSDYFKERCLSSDFSINAEWQKVIQVVSLVSELNDKKLDELICIWFLECLLEKDVQKMKQLKSILPSDKLKGCLDSLYFSYYRTSLP